MAIDATILQVDREGADVVLTLGNRQAGNVGTASRTVVVA